jgi:beta-glucosidase
VVAELLWGVVTPSGKVPTTYAARAEDLMHHGDPVRHPGVDEGEGWPTIRYTEGLQVGYRWFQSQGIVPLFPFGYGLSYTTFEIGDVSLSAATTDGTAPVHVRARVTNTGDRRGAEVLQVYVAIPGTGQPPKRLVGFQKVWLDPGKSAEVAVTIDPAATAKPLSVWDYATGSFRVVPGDHRLLVGTSSEDTPHELALAVSA